MSHQPVTPSLTQTPALKLRPELAGDESFLFELYASVREDELNLAGWDEATRSVFLKLQFKAMRQGYGSQFPKATFSIITLGDQPVGRMVVDWSGDVVRLVDIALLPGHRRRGLGSRLIREVGGESGRLGKSLRLEVLRANRAVTLYERLGFVRVGEDGVYIQMEWRPAS